MNPTMYDTFSLDYDRFVNWPARLALEMPFILAQLETFGVNKILDAACGTGMHAIALAQHGFRVSGTDLSEPMIARARQNAQEARTEARFETAGFGSLARVFGEGSFDCILCLGNSLPHLLTSKDQREALNDFAACLRQGGLLLIQNRNFDGVLARQERWMDPQSHQENQGEWIFLRFYDFQADGHLNFNIVTLSRQPGEPWQQRVTSSQLYPLRQVEMSALLQAGGFSDVNYYGGLSQVPFDPITSGNLVVAARRK